MYKRQFEDRSKLLPLLPRGLAAANQNAPPEPIDAIPEDAQLVDVAGNSMVLVVAGYDLAEPYTDLTGAIMLAALKLNLDGFEPVSYTHLDVYKRQELLSGWRVG